MARISSINGNPIVPSNGSVGTAQVASGYNLMTDDEKSKLSGVPAQGNTPFSSINGNPIHLPEVDSLAEQVADMAEAIDVLATGGGASGGASVDLIGYLKKADAEATYAPKSHKHAMADVTGLQAALDAIGAETASEVSALGTRMDDAESSIAELAKRLPIYYYTDVPSESSIAEKPQLAVIKGGAVYLVE